MNNYENASKVYGSCLKNNVDDALNHLANNNPIKHVIVQKRTGSACSFNPKLDIWWHELVQNQSNIYLYKLRYHRGCREAVKQFILLHCSQRDLHCRCH
jgi:hypothetical protein